MADDARDVVAKFLILRILTADQAQGKGACDPPDTVFFCRRDDQVLFVTSATLDSDHKILEQSALRGWAAPAPLLS